MFVMNIQDAYCCQSAMENICLSCSVLIDRVHVESESSSGSPKQLCIIICCAVSCIILVNSPAYQSYFPSYRPQFG